MTEIKCVIERAAVLYHDDAPIRMQGVIIITDTRLVSSKVHWTIPELRNADGISAFCLHVYGNAQYNVFKSSNVDSLKRVTVSDFLTR
uniref:Uncharacterized protein n=1 Tax=Parascaris equorum TaxID=6256 RepID=A0A914RCY4_PAREQ